MVLIGYVPTWFALQYQLRVGLPCLPDNNIGPVLIFTPKFTLGLIIGGFSHYDMSKNEVTK